MNYISLDNLTRYHSKFKDYADAKYTLAKDYGWKQTEKAGAVTCWPVGESRMKPVVEFLFKETLPVGDKSSQNPSTITGVSEVTIKHRTSNLLYPIEAASGTTRDVNWSSNGDGSFTFNGTPSSDSDAVAGYWNLSDIPNGIYRLKIKGSELGTHPRIVLRIDNNGSVTYPAFTENSSSYISVTVTDTKKITSIYFRLITSYTFNNITISPYFTLGDLDYDIPRSDSYTISFGNTFYGGILDVSTGKLTVTHRMIEADSLTLDISNYPAYLPLECTDTFGRTITSTGNILALTGSTGGKIVYKLANPYTVQIDPVAITSLPQIDKYTPRLNTLYTDAENIIVKYIKSPIRDEYEKVQAIIANGGTI